MSDNKKIRFNEDGKLVIENDNAEILDGHISSKIFGTYEISAEDVEKLSVLLNGDTLAKTIYSYQIIGSLYIPGSQSTYIITSDNAVAGAMDVVSKEYNALDKEYKELKNRHAAMEEKHNNLLEKVKKHNKYSLFNKIEIEGGKQ